MELAALKNVPGLALHYKPSDKDTLVFSSMLHHKVSTSELIAFVAAYKKEHGSVLTEFTYELASAKDATERNDLLAGYLAELAIQLEAEKAAGTIATDVEQVPVNRRVWFVKHPFCNGLVVCHNRLAKVYVIDLYSASTVKPVDMEEVALVVCRLKTEFGRWYDVVSRYLSSNAGNMKPDEVESTWAFMFRNMLKKVLKELR
jgi:hypothetical protein